MRKAKEMFLERAAIKEQRFPRTANKVIFFILAMAFHFRFDDIQHFVLMISTICDRDDMLNCVEIFFLVESLSLCSIVVCRFLRALSARRR